MTLLGTTSATSRPTEQLWIRTESCLLWIVVNRSELEADHPLLSQSDLQVMQPILKNLSMAAIEYCSTQYRRDFTKAHG